MAERIIWTLAVATAGAFATAVATRTVALVWRKTRGTAPPGSVPGLTALGSGVGKKAARRLLGL